MKVKIYGGSYRVNIQTSDGRWVELSRLEAKELVIFLAGHFRSISSCEAYFRELVERNPDELISLIESGELGDCDLSFAAEILGASPDSCRVVPVLVGLLDHPSALVREGAVYGLGEHESHMTREVREKLGQLAHNDPNEEVREIAEEMVSDEHG